MADLNGDGRRDVAVTISSPTAVAVLLGDGTGQLGGPAYYPAARQTQAGASART